jgi:uncharacterized membrane protein
MSDEQMDGVHPYPVAGRKYDAAKRRAAAKVASNTRWAHEPDRRAATQAARDGLQRRFEDHVDPERVLDPVERARRAESAKRAHFTRLAQKSAAARAARKAGSGGSAGEVRRNDGA